MAKNYSIKLSFEIAEDVVSFDRGFREVSTEYSEQETEIEMTARTLSAAIEKVRNMEVKKNVTPLAILGAAREGGRFHSLDIAL